jgi:hypothetical protein
MDFIGLGFAVNLFDAVSRDGFDSVKELRLLGDVYRRYEIVELV